MITDARAEPSPRALPTMSPWATDPLLGERLAQSWVAAYRPGRRVAQARTHSTLYRGPGDLSTRVGIRLDGDGPAGEVITLLVRDRLGEVSVTEFPDDPLLPTLAAVLRDGALAPVLRGTELESASATTTLNYHAEVVHHPREGPCVLRLRLGRAEAYAKVYPRAAQANAAAEALYAVATRQVVAADGGVVRLPRALGVSVPLQTTVLESITSPTATAALAGDARRVASVDTARALRALHAHAPDGPLPVVPALEHLDRVRREQELVATAWPDVAERVDDAVRTAASVLEDLTHSGWEPVLCHGDFTPGQLVRVPRGLGLLDLDTVALGDPAADIGRFLAYEEVRAARVGRSASGSESFRTAFLAAYGAPPGGVDPSGLQDRVWAHRRLNLALIALRATRRLKGARSALALALLDRSDPTPGRLP